jgi:hypothetical protein
MIRLYIGEEGLRSNKSPMPFYGQVWRQSSSPVLWVEGKHDPSQLKAHSLRREPEITAQPILAAAPTVDTEVTGGNRTSMDDLNEPFNPAHDIEPPLFDTDDEEDEDEDEDEEMGRVPNKPINDDSESEEDEDEWDYGQAWQSEPGQLSSGPSQAEVWLGSSLAEPAELGQGSAR